MSLDFSENEGKGIDSLKREQGNLGREISRKRRNLILTTLPSSLESDRGILYPVSYYVESLDVVRSFAHIASISTAMRILYKIAFA